jgi:hypothetical protein
VVVISIKICTIRFGYQEKIPEQQENDNNNNNRKEEKKMDNYESKFGTLRDLNNNKKSMSRSS